MQCKCVEKSNEYFRQFNGRLDTTEFINTKTGKIYTGFKVPMTKLDTRKRQKPPFLIAAFCPICGTKIKENDE